MSAPLPAAFEGDFERTGFESSIPDRFREILDKYPDRLAVKHHTGSWSYSDLDQAANRIANGLTRRRGTATETVGLMIEREGPAIAAILGVLKCGKIYVPLDRSHPPDRIAAIIKDCEIRTVITDTTHGPWSNALPSECSVIAERELSMNESGEFTHSRIAADALAAVFYTSGTTGRPKGVMQSHVNVLHRVMLYTKFAKISALDRFSLVTAPTYSASLPNLFGALLNGASIFPFSILDRGLTPLPSWLSREGITIYFSVPSVFRQWTALIVGEDLSALRVIVLAGEAVVARDVEIFKKHFSERCELVNLLASNETGFVRTNIIRKTTEQVEPVIPVGYAMEDKEVLILDDNGQEMEPGQTGEIAIRSAYLSPGYWRQPALTAATFVTDSTSPDRKTYRTGDLGCVLPDGCLIYKGRKNFRVKIRGIRVEPEEVEAALRVHPSIQDAAVVVRENSAAEAYLVAYVVCRDQVALTPKVLRRYLSEKLPQYMLPSRIVVLSALPYASNGKVDRSALPMPPANRDGQDSFVPPRDNFEYEIAKIWEMLLGLEPAGIQDDFFESGGDSLKALELLARLEKTFGRKLPPATLLKSPTVESLASVLRQEKGDAPMSSLVRIQKGNGSASVFCVLFSGGFKTEFYSFARLAPMVGRDYSFYGVIARGTDGLSRPHQSVEDMAKAYIEEMRSVQPQGPYFLIGECFSAPVAYEIARQLRLDGQIVGLLAVLDGQGNRHWVYRYLGNRLGARVRYVMINIRDTSTVMYLRHGIPFHLGEIRKKGVTPWLLHLLRRRVSARLSPTTQISESRIPVLKPSPALRRAHKAYSLAVRRYERPPYEGKITVIANEEWYRADSTLGWDAVGGVESHAIPGDHNTYLKKHPQMVADLLRAGIEAGKAHSETGERHAAAS